MKSWNEECAVVGIFNVPNSAIMTYYSLFAMQHRGQEASGISVFDGKQIKTIKGSGLVSDIFDKENLSTLSGSSSIGHNRYATAGSLSSGDSQPIYAKLSFGEISVAHNGNFTNAAAIRERLMSTGSIFNTYLDTENLVHLFAKSDKKTDLEKIISSVEQIEGAYSLVILMEDKLVALRDGNGIRPLSIGEIQNTDGSIGYIVASETCAFDLIGAKYVRDVDSGEMVVFDKDGMRSINVFEKKSFKCIFEYVYFARPDSYLFGNSVYEIRKNMGVELAKEYKIQADMVIPVPDSGVPAAIGYAKESGIPFEMGIIRNHYVGRTFIEPDQSLRELKVGLKLNPIKELIDGKDLIVIDDSIVRGTTSMQIVKILKRAGAKRVHLLISSPPTIFPCYYGVDTPERESLICAQKTIDEVREFVGVDTLGFLSDEGLDRSVKGGGFCKACFDGNYIH